MQFVYVLISVIVVAAAIWLVSRHMRMKGNKSSVTAGKRPAEKLVDSFSYDNYYGSASDRVELGPVQTVNGNSDDDSEQQIDEYEDEFEETEYGASDIEPYPTDDVAVDEDSRDVESVESWAEDSDDEVDSAHDVQTGSDSFDSRAEESQATEEKSADLEPIAEVTTAEDSVEIADEDEQIQSVEDQAEISQAETNSIDAEGEADELLPELPEIEDSAPYFGEYSKMQVGSRHVQNGTSELSQQTKLKLPEFSNASQSGISEIGQPIQTELEVSVVFPDYLDSKDREIDVIGWLPAESNAIKRMDVLTIYKNLEFQLDQPHSIVGFDIDSGRWNNLEKTDVISRYSDLIFTMQLSHRGQPVSEKNWWKFTRMVEHVANALSRTFHFSMTTDTVIKEAQLLNSQTRDLDLQAILLLKSDHEEQFSKKSIEYLAREYDLRERPGTTVFDRFDGSSDSFPLFSIVPMNDANVLLAEELGQGPDMRTMILFSNLACVPNPRLAFDTMFDVAKDLEDRLAVKLIDQNHKRVNLHSISRIRSKIDEFVALMERYRITPGGDVAMRLFESSLMVKNWAESQGVVSLKPIK